MLNNLLIKIITFYCNCLSSLKLPSCRYIPTCSEYTITALKEYGTWQGLLLSFKRLLRCHPWGGHGYDPVVKG